jgi:hypothetical protein
MITGTRLCNEGYSGMAHIATVKGVIRKLEGEFGAG